MGVRAGAVAELVDEQVGITALRAEGSLLAQAVRDLYDRDLDSLGAAARARVLQQYSWDLALRQQQSIYAGLSEKKRILPEAWATASRVPSGAKSDQTTSLVCGSGGV